MEATALLLREELPAGCELKSPAKVIGYLIFLIRSIFMQLILHFCMFVNNFNHSLTCNH